MMGGMNIRDEVCFHAHLGPGLTVISDNNYNNLTNIPVVNVKGIVGDPINIMELDPGIYKITGFYILPGEEEVKNTVVGLIAICDETTFCKVIKCITNKFVRDYMIDNNLGTISESKYLTEEILDSKGFVTKDELSNQLQVLGFITKDDTKILIEDTVEEMVAPESLIDDLFK